jgi:hypothetical protein
MSHALAASQFFWNKASTWSPPSVALMKTKRVPASFTSAQSISLCHFERSMPWMGKVCALATPGCGLASPFFG